MEFLSILNYQQIVDLVAHVISVALPIGLIFGLSGKLVNLFMDFVFGKDKVSL